jgi:predicted CXXCH cytochrome family protein
MNPIWRSPSAPAILSVVMTAVWGLCADEAQQPAYTGSDKCIECHRAQQPAIVQGWQRSAHRRTMTVLRSEDPLPDRVQWPPSLKREEARAILGRLDGEYVFIARDFRVIVSAAWQREEADAPHDVIGDPGRPVDASRQCLGCHSTGYSVSRKAFAEPGITCEACHGPGSRHVDSPAGKGTIIHPGKLPPDRSRMICGQCHSLGKDPSGNYPFPVMGKVDAARPFRPGEDLAGAFVDARPKVEGKGWEYSLLVQSSQRYSTQRCTDCHDPHGKTGHPSMLLDPTSETCLRCHGVGSARLRFENHWGLGDAIKHPCWGCHHNAHSH